MDPILGSKKWTFKWGPFSLSYCNKSRNPILGSTFWTPKWGPLLATCLTILGDALCGRFRIPALSLLKRICFVGAGYLMTSKAAGKSCVSAFVSAQRRPFMGAPVFAANFGPYFGVCFRKLLWAMNLLSVIWSWLLPAHVIDVRTTMFRRCLPEYGL